MKEILLILQLYKIIYNPGTSLVAQWLRIHLPMQGTWVWALVQEDPTCRGATKPVHHNYWAHALGPTSHNYWAHVPQLLKPVGLETVLCNKRSHCNEKPTHRNEEQPLLAPTRETPRLAMKTQRSQKKKKKKIIYNPRRKILCKLIKEVGLTGSNVIQVFPLSPLLYGVAEVVPSPALVPFHLRALLK